MRTLIISDTHGSLSAWKKAWDLAGNVEQVIHAGDVLYHGPRNPLPAGYDPAGLAAELHNLETPLTWVRGNCDADVDLMVVGKGSPPASKLNINRHKVLIVHGHQPLPADADYDLIISGHTHLPVLERKDGKVLLNPGSPALPKENNPPSIAVWDAKGIKILNLETGESMMELAL
ncbi:MAG: phosphodiesterase [Firmicutes bacterium]|nr:phosphodiesterase [Bacillota bacterium]